MRHALTILLAVLTVAALGRIVSHCSNPAAVDPVSEPARDAERAADAKAQELQRRIQAMPPDAYDWNGAVKAATAVINRGGTVDEAVAAMEPHRTAPRP